MSATASRLIVLTGATRGLGRALTEQFVQLGHTVLGCGRSAKTVAELHKACPRTLPAIHLSTAGLFADGGVAGRFSIPTM
jgi:NADP-dependent 3-hydroxy acid dehydrogenase YdfG